MKYKKIYWGTGSSTTKRLSHMRGQTLLELMLAIALAVSAIALAASAAGRSGDSLNVSADELEARSVVRGCLEAVRSLRDDSFSQLTEGEYAPILTDGQWTLEGVEPEYTGPVVTLTEISLGIFDATCAVTRSAGSTHTKEVTLTTRLTNWKENADVQRGVFIEISSATVASTSDAIFDVRICNDESVSKTITSIRIAWEDPSILTSLVIDGIEHYGPLASIQSNEDLALPSIMLAADSCVALTSITFDRGFESGHMFFAATIQGEFPVTRHVQIDML